MCEFEDHEQHFESIEMAQARDLNLHKNARIVYSHVWRRRMEKSLKFPDPIFSVLWTLVWFENSKYLIIQKCPQTANGTIWVCQSQHYLITFSVWPVVNSDYAHRHPFFIPSKSNDRAMVLNNSPFERPLSDCKFFRLKVYRRVDGVSWTASGECTWERKDWVVLWQHNWILTKKRDKNLRVNKHLQSIKPNRWVQISIRNLFFGVKANLLIAFRGKIYWISNSRTGVRSDAYFGFGWRVSRFLFSLFFFRSEFWALPTLGWRGDNETPLFLPDISILFPHTMLRLKENRLFIHSQSLALINKHRFEIQICCSFSSMLRALGIIDDSIWKNNWFA